MYGDAIEYCCIFFLIVLLHFLVEMIEYCCIWMLKWFYPLECTIDLSYTGQWTLLRIFRRDKWLNLLCSVIHFTIAFSWYAGYFLHNLRFIIWLGKFGSWSYANFSSYMQSVAEIRTQAERRCKWWQPIFSVPYRSSKGLIVWIPWIHLCYSGTSNIALLIDLLLHCLPYIPKSG